MAGAAGAHGFGQRFDLPLPLWLWESGAAASIVVSFILLALFVGAAPSERRYASVDLLASPLGRRRGSALLLHALRAIAVAVFLTTVCAGLLGTGDPFRNLAPTMVWIIGWVGLAFASVLLGDIWALLNPWATLYAWAEAGFRRATGQALSLDRPYPSRLGCWPGVAAFLAFAWAELIWPDRDLPSALGLALALYSVWTWLGMAIYGRVVWLRHGEIFAMTFGILARCAPFAIDPEEPAWRLRPPALALLDDYPVEPTRVLFILAMLATVSFDGLLETPLWFRFTNALLTSPGFSALLAPLRDLGIEDLLLIRSVGLVAMPFLFLAVYLLCCAAMDKLAGNDRPLKTRPPAVQQPANRQAAIQRQATLGGKPTTDLLARSFVVTLVPIAIAYQIAHYQSLLLTTGQFVIPLASDPFGWGWNLWGSAGYQPDLLFVDVRWIWYSAVAAIVLGHIASVYLAHLMAFDLYRERRAALLSQVPMIALMVLYTMSSLWILAQPMVG